MMNELASTLKHSLLATMAIAVNMASAQGLPAAQAFVESLYNAYQVGNGPHYLGNQSAAVFAPSLLMLILRDQVQAQGETGALDQDPICNCQDFDITDVKVRVMARKVPTARADVGFLNAQQPQALTLDLVAIGGQWRVSDVRSKAIPSLVLFLASNTKRPETIGHCTKVQKR